MRRPWEGKGGCQGSSGVHQGPSEVCQEHNKGSLGIRRGPLGSIGGNFGVNQGFIGGLSIRSLLGVY